MQTRKQQEKRRGLGRAFLSRGFEVCERRDTKTEYIDCMFYCLIHSFTQLTASFPPPIACPGYHIWMVYALGRTGERLLLTRFSGQAQANRPRASEVIRKSDRQRGTTVETSTFGDLAPNDDDAKPRRFQMIRCFSGRANYRRRISLPGQHSPLSLSYLPRE